MLLSCCRRLCRFVQSNCTSDGARCSAIAGSVVGECNSILGEAKGFLSFLKRPHRLWSPPSQGQFPWAHIPEANITASTAEGKNVCSYSTALPYAFTVCSGKPLLYFTTFHLPCIYQIQKYVNNQQNSLQYLLCILFTMFSPTCFGRYCCHLQSDIIITKYKSG